MCSNLEVGSVTAIFCPDLRYLVDTEELLASSVSGTQNYLELEENEDLLQMTAHSMSQESSHRNAMIFIINRNEVWRIEAGQDEEGNNTFQKTLIFRLRILQEIKSIEVYDGFAFVLFEDESVLIAKRPEVEGDFASYNNFIPEINDTRRGTLHYDDTPIQYYSIVGDSSQNYQYIMNVLTMDSDSVQYLSQEGIYYDP